MALKLRNISKLRLALNANFKISFLNEKMTTHTLANVRLDSYIHIYIDFRIRQRPAYTNAENDHICTCEKTTLCNTEFYRGTTEILT